MMKSNHELTLKQGRLIWSDWDSYRHKFEWTSSEKVSFNFPSLDASWTIIHGGYLLKGQTQTPFLFSYFERVTMTDWFIFCKGKNWCSWPINKRFISLALLTQVVHVKDQNLVVYTTAVFHVQGAKLSGAC